MFGRRAVARISIAGNAPKAMTAGEAVPPALSGCGVEQRNAAMRLVTISAWFMPCCLVGGSATQSIAVAKLRAWTTSKLYPETPVLSPRWEMFWIEVSSWSLRLTISR
jgi:hypothetical protein